MFERFTSQSRRVVVLAQEEARELNHNYIGTEHLLLGLLHEGNGTGAQSLTAAGITLEAARVEVETIVGLGKEPLTGHIPFTSRAKKCLELSLREALQLGDNYIGTGHLLLGLIHKGGGVGVQVLERLGADLPQLRERVTAELEDDPEFRDGPDEAPTVRPSRQRDPIRQLLDTIDNRLSSIEGHLGITRPEPPAAPAAGAGAAAGSAEAGSGSGEIGRLNAEVARLKALLREHDIEPGESGATGTVSG